MYWWTRFYVFGSWRFNWFLEIKIKFDSNTQPKRSKRVKLKSVCSKKIKSIITIAISLNTRNKLRLYLMYKMIYEICCLLGTKTFLFGFRIDIRKWIELEKESIVTHFQSVRIQICFLLPFPFSPPLIFSFFLFHISLACT